MDDFRKDVLLNEMERLLKELREVREELITNYGVECIEEPNDAVENKIWLKEMYERIKFQITRLDNRIPHNALKEIKQTFSISSYRHHFFYDKLKRDGIIMSVDRGHFALIDCETTRQNNFDLNKLREERFLQLNFKQKETVIIKQENKQQIEQPLIEESVISKPMGEEDVYFNIRKHIFSLNPDDDEYSTIVEIKNKFSLNNNQYGNAYARLCEDGIITVVRRGYFKLTEGMSGAIQKYKDQEQREFTECIHEDIYDYVLTLNKKNHHSKSEIQNKFNCSYGTLRRAIDMLYEHGLIEEVGGYIEFTNDKPQRIKDSENEDDYVKPLNYTEEEKKKIYEYDPVPTFGKL